MIHSTATRIQSLAILFLAAHWTSFGGEWKQRERATPTGNVVRVRDVVECVADEGLSVRTEEEAILNLELFPSPPTLKSLRLSRTDLQQALLLHGVAVREWKWSGAEETLVVHRGAVPSNVQRAAHDDQPGALRSSRKTATTSAESNRSVEAAEPAGTTAIKVVSVNRPIARGEILNPHDVQLIPADAKGLSHGLFEISEVVGKEASRNLLPGKAIEASHLQPPRIVKRDDEVLVTSRAAGVKVEERGKALQDGALGEVIAVVTIEGKQRVSARITGPRQLDIYASSPRFEVETKKSSPAVLPAGASE